MADVSWFLPTYPKHKNNVLSQEQKLSWPQTSQESWKLYFNGAVHKKLWGGEKYLKPESFIFRRYVFIRLWKMVYCTQMLIKYTTHVSFLKNYLQGSISCLCKGWELGSQELRS